MCGEYPIRQEYLEPLDEADWGRIYDYWMSETVPCLESEDLVIAEPPTRETFVERRAWTPDSDAVRDQVRDRVSRGDYPTLNMCSPRCSPYLRRRRCGSGPEPK